jgi:hypothetical protein
VLSFQLTCQLCRCSHQSNRPTPKGAADAEGAAAADSIDTPTPATANADAVRKRRAKSDDSDDDDDDDDDGDGDDDEAGAASSGKAKESTTGPKAAKKPKAERKDSGTLSRSILLSGVPAGVTEKMLYVVRTLCECNAVRTCYNDARSARSFGLQCCALQVTSVHLYAVRARCSILSAPSVTSVHVPTMQE